MDKEKWTRFGEEVAPILKELKQLCRNYKLETPLSLAAFADDYCWADYIDHDNDGDQYEVLLTKNGTIELSVGKGAVIDTYKKIIRS